MNPASGSICNDCRDLGDFISGMFEETKNVLSTVNSPEDEISVKLIRELSFVASTDSFLNVYRRIVELLIRTFRDETNEVIDFNLITKNVHTQLNYFHILNELKESDLVEFVNDNNNPIATPRMKIGKVLRHVIDEIRIKRERENAEIRYAHILSTYSVLPLLMEYSRCQTKSEVRQMSPIPKRPWLMMLQLMIRKSGDRVNIEKLRKNLNSSRASPDTFTTLVTHLSSESTAHIQKLVVDSKGEGNEKEFVLDSEMVKYIDRLRENIREREMS
jgi:ribosomal protein L19